MNKNLFINLKYLLLGFVLLLVFSTVLYSVANKKNIPNKKIITNQQSEPSPTPFPFQEMTIPYLRQRKYISQLKNLDQLEENDSYTTYLTSYTSDGLNINGLLTIPKGQRPIQGWPAIVFVHGYIPPQVYKTTERYAAYVDYLAKNGFVVFKIDLRGHGNSEGTPGGGYYSSDYVIDTLNAYSALQSADFINKSTVGLWGHSMAGNALFRSMVIKKNIPAIVIWAGAVYTYSDMRVYGIHDKSYQPPIPNAPSQEYRKLLLEKYGNFDPKSSFWQQVVPTNYLEGVSGAIQIDHAVDDPVVPIGYSRNLMKILDKTTIYHELQEYPSGGHNITEPEFTNAMENTVKFFKKYLSNTP